MNGTWKVINSDMSRIQPTEKILMSLLFTDGNQPPTDNSATFPDTHNRKLTTPSSNVSAVLREVYIRSKGLPYETNPSVSEVPLPLVRKSSYIGIKLNDIKNIVSLVV